MTRKTTSNRDNLILLETVRDNGSGMSDEPRNDGREEACLDNIKLSLSIVSCDSKSTWDDYVARLESANFLQSWDFYEFHRARGKEVVRKLIYKDQKIVGAYAGVVETARRGRYMAIAGGPLIDWDDAEVIDAVFQDIRTEGQKHNCVFVRVRPQRELSDESLECLKNHGLTPAPMYLSVEYAGLLDLHQTEAEILAGASQGFRRKLRKAKKADITVTADDSEESINEFCKLEKLHAERQKYVAFSSDFLKQQFEAFKKGGEVLIYTARKDGEILAQNFMIFYGIEASYHYGVSSELGTKYSAAPLLHLAAMEEARRRDMTRYNLWGIVGKDETSHRFYGVSEFKRSFGCAEYHYTPAHDMILNPFKYQINKLVETLRKIRRHV